VQAFNTTNLNSTQSKTFISVQKLIAIFNTSEQSGAFNHEYGSWASEPKARTPTIQENIIKILLLFIINIISSLVIQLPSLLTIFSEQKPLKSNDHGKINLFPVISFVSNQYCMGLFRLLLLFILPGYFSITNSLHNL
jgi:hypothetical protein